MSESLKHYQLVMQLKKFVIENLNVKKELINIDIVGDRTKILFTGYKPDLFYEYDRTIIGEAKTSMDVDREHSIEQYKSYLRYCDLKGNSSVVVINSSWTDSIYLSKILKNIKKENNYKTHIIIINDLDKVKDI